MHSKCDQDTCMIYYLKVKLSKNLLDILKKGEHIRFDKLYNDYVKDLDLHSDNINVIVVSLYKLLCFFETRASQKKSIEKPTKSEGEILALVSVTLLMTSNILINSQQIPNPVTAKKLEMDLYVTNSDLVIEIDGTQHRDKTQQNRDKIKNILLGSANIALIRIDWDGKLDKFVQDLYIKLEEFAGKNDKFLALDKKKFMQIVKHFHENAKRRTVIELTTDVLASGIITASAEVPSPMSN